MKIFKYITYIISAVALLTACEAELEDLPVGEVTLSVTWDGDHPRYEVTTDGELAIDDITIYETFKDTHFGYPDRTRPIKVSLSEGSPYVYKQTVWQAYGNDKFEAYAKVSAISGVFHSNTVSITYPTDGITKITNATFESSWSDCQLVIKGENFDIKAAYKIDGMSIRPRSATPVKLIFDTNHLDINESGMLNKTLTINDKAYPFTVDYPVARINSLSKKTVEIGDTIAVSLKDVCIRQELIGFRNANIVSYEKGKFILMPLSDKSGEIDITPYNVANNNESCEKVKINVTTDTKWTKVSEINTQFDWYTATSEKWLCKYSENKEILSIYNVASGKMERSMEYINHGYMQMCIVGDGLYITQGKDYGAPGPNYRIEKIDLNTGKMEKFAEYEEYINNLTYDGKYLIGEEVDCIHQFNLENKSVTKKNGVSRYNYDLIGAENGCIYGKSSNTIFRYNPDNNRIEESYLTTQLDKTPYFKVVKDGWTFHYNICGNYTIIFKKNFDKAYDFKFLGGIKKASDEETNYRALAIDNKFYYVFISENNKIVVYKTPIK